MNKNPNFQVIQYKILYRTHYTSQKIFQMGLTQISAHGAQITHLMITCMLSGFVHQYRNFGLRYEKIFQHGSIVEFLCGWVSHC